MTNDWSFKNDFALIMNKRGISFRIKALITWTWFQGLGTYAWLKHFIFSTDDCGGASETGEPDKISPVWEVSLFLSIVFILDGVFLPSFHFQSSFWVCFAWFRLIFSFSLIVPTWCNLSSSAFVITVTWTENSILGSVHVRLDHPLEVTISDFDETWYNTQVSYMGVWNDLQGPK